MDKIVRNVVDQEDFRHVAERSEHVFATIQEIAVRDHGVVLHVQYEAALDDNRILFSKPVSATFGELETFQKEHGEPAVIINMGEFVFYLVNVSSGYRVKVSHDVMENIRKEIKSIAPSAILCG